MFLIGLLAGFLLGASAYWALDWGVRTLFRALDRSEREYHHEHFHGEPR